nr:Ig-like domain-containing protein [Cellulomonas sp. JH27-2]
MWSPVATDGSFSLPTIRGRCYSLYTGDPALWDERVSGLERVRAGTSGVVAHPRFYTWPRVSGAERKYGNRVVVVHVDVSEKVKATDGGTVTLKEGSTVLGTAVVHHGVAAVRTRKALVPGRHRVTMVYGGTGTYGSSRSTYVLTFQKARTSVKVTASHAGSKNRSTVTFSLKVAFKPSGKMQVSVDGTKHRASFHRVGKTYVATVHVTGVHTGKHEVRAYYRGDKRVAYVDVARALTVKR